MTTVRELLIRLTDFPLDAPVVIDVDDGIAKSYRDVIHVREAHSATGARMVVLDADYDEPVKHFQLKLPQV